MSRKNALFYRERRLLWKNHTHYAIQTLRHKFIRLHLHVDPDELHSDWKYRMQTIAVRCRVAPGSLKPGSVMRELYDLRTDPKEGRNLLPSASEDDAAMAHDLENTLNAWVDETKSARPTTKYCSNPRSMKGGIC